MPDFPRISSLPCRRSFFFFFGLGTQDICSIFLNENLFFISPFLPLLVVHFTLFCMNRINFLTTYRAGNRADRANSELGQNRARLKLARFFRAKILVAQLALKIGLVGPNSLLKAKKIRAGRAEPGHTGLGHIGLGQIWPGFFFRANNLMAQPGPNSGWTGLANRAGPILPPLAA